MNLKDDILIPIFFFFGLNFKKFQNTLIKVFIGKIYNLKKLIFFSFILVSFQSFGLSLWQIQEEILKSRPLLSILEEGRSLFPNEFYISHNLHIWKKRKGPAQGYLSVGSERSFIGASLTEANVLIGIDRDPMIVRYNRINSILLGISQTPEDYIKLRFSKNYYEIKERLEKVSKEYKIDSTDWSWWQKTQEGHLWTELFFSPRPSIGLQKLREVAYWNNYNQWLHLKNLFLNGKMGFFQIDMSETPAIRALVTFLDELGLKLSHVDTSNVLDYIGLDKMADFLIQLEPLADLSGTPQQGIHWIYTSLKLHRFNPHIHVDLDLEGDKWTFHGIEINSEIIKKEKFNYIQSITYNMPLGHKSYRCLRALDSF